MGARALRFLRYGMEGASSQHRQSEGFNFYGELLPFEVGYMAGGLLLHTRKLMLRV